ncbi:beta-ketoacyl synthase N-terminal-like domain-containing protein [Streptomyces palmae]|uniref:Beta-ketoacyl synthase n=1 Tax=Streptomyces palmae TaxID=1701085 RepID=A0A4Z0HAN0_9ACTN|nr:beta-ketoacyl synthase N-terminal-like domain-containing protein [Streptomyces palmae]TGB10574.1 beta-ketoacyl synthase [Streptomyces palmae]
MTGSNPASGTRIQITGVGLALPGATSAAELLRQTPAPAEPFDTAQVIGKRGHRYKDRATQLALCAAIDGLRDAGLIPADSEELAVPGTSMGVVASSNLGNLDTVCGAAEQINRESVGAISPMGLPNASSNVVASHVAIRFKLRGPNLMLCNGPTSGLDAVHWAANLIAADRVRRALVIGVETRNEIVEGLLRTEAAELLDGAVALVVESAEAAAERGAAPVAELGRYRRQAGLDGCLEPLLADPDQQRPAPGIWFTPERYAPDGTAPVPASVPRHDLSRAFGRSSGALGVLQCAAATGWLAAQGSGRALLTNGDDSADAVASLLLDRPGADS